MTTDERIEALGNRLARVYSTASKDLAKKADAYFERFKRLDAQKRKKVEDGTLSEKEYKKWRQNRIMEGKRWEDVKEQIAQTMANANKIAASYINGELPPLYAQNFNEVGHGAERAISGYSFDLTDANTVKNLSTQNKTLLPYKVVDGKRDIRWNTRMVNSSVLQSILQGDSIPQMARRLAVSIPEMNYVSAMRNARTACTGAENKGRLDGMKQLQDDGVILKKEWIAAIDTHTREAHAELNGVQEDIDKPFKNSIGKIMFPGDPNADPANVYNCRCTISQVIVGFEKREEKIEYEWGDIPDEQARIYESTISQLSRDFPLENSPITYIGDFKRAYGYKFGTDYFDILYEHPELERIGAEYIPGGTKFSKKPYILVYTEEAGTKPLKETLSEFADLREKKGYASKANYFYNLGSGEASNIIAHEYGHAVAEDAQLYWGEKNYNELEKIFEAHDRDYIAKYISEYAATNPEEMLAEAFVAWQEPRLRNEFVEEIMQLVFKHRRK